MKETFVVVEAGKDFDGVMYCNTIFAETEEDAKEKFIELLRNFVGSEEGRENFYEDYKDAIAQQKFVDYDDDYILVIKSSKEN